MKLSFYLIKSRHKMSAKERRILTRFDTSEINSDKITCPGPYKRLKYICDDDSVEIGFCPVKLMESMNLKFSVNKFILSGLQAHHKLYGCSTETLALLTFNWISEVSSLFLKERDKRMILNEIEQILLELIESVNSTLTRNIDKFLKSESSGHLQNAVKIQSRYFCGEQKFGEDEDVINGEMSKKMQTLVVGLSHGDNNFITVAPQLWNHQVTLEGLDKKLNLNKIVTIQEIGQPLCTHMNGLVLKTKYQSDTLEKFSGLSVNALLINGSLTSEYRHLGLNLPVTTKLVVKDIRNLCIGDSFSEIKSIISKFAIKLVLLSGVADKNLLNWSLAEEILVIEQIPLNHLQSLSSVTEAQILTYVKDCDEDNVASNLLIKSLQHCSKNYILIENTNIETVFIKALTEADGSNKIHRLSHSLHRLRNITDSRKVLPGGALTEYWTCKWLEKYDSKTEHNQLATEILSRGFATFCKKVKENVSLGDREQVNVCHCFPEELYEANKMWNFENMACTKCHKTVVLDDHISKIEAWKSALRMTYVICRCDALILTGASKNELFSFKDMNFKDIIGML